MLRGVDPGEADHQDHHQGEEKKLDPDRHADQPARAPRTLAAPLAIGGVGDELPAALVARDLCLGHPSEYVSLG